jgi:hypothetical protein
MWGVGIVLSLIGAATLCYNWWVMVDGTGNYGSIIPMLGGVAAATGVVLMGMSEGVWVGGVLLLADPGGVCGIVAGLVRNMRQAES